MENTHSRAHDNNNICTYDIIKMQFFEIKRMIPEETLKAFPNNAIGCQVKINAGNLMHIRIGSTWLRKVEDGEEESRCLDNTRRLLCTSLLRTSSMTIRRKLKLPWLRDIRSGIVDSRWVIERFLYTGEIFTAAVKAWLPQSILIHCARDEEFSLNVAWYKVDKNLI